MVLEVSFCGYSPLLFNPNMRQNTMLESLWESKAVYLISDKRAGKGGRKRKV